MKYISKKYNRPHTHKGKKVKGKSSWKELKIKRGKNGNN